MYKINRISALDQACFEGLLTIEGFRLEIERNDDTTNVYAWRFGEIFAGGIGDDLASALKDCRKDIEERFEDMGDELSTWVEKGQKS